MRIHIGMVSLWYSTAMVVYSYGQASRATVFSQELLVVTVKLATRQSVMPLLCLMSDHNIGVRESGSKKEVSALHVLLDTCR